MTEAAAALVAGLRTEPVEEVKYLVEGRVPVYRTIVAFLHDRLEETETGWVWPAEITERLNAVQPEGGSRYTEEETRRHLDSLERWRVLLSEQDLGRATSLEEFLRTPRRYQISERARRIERMVRDLEYEGNVQGSLDPGRLRRLWTALVALDHLLGGTTASSLSRDQLRDIEAEWNAAEDTRAQIEEQAMRYLNDLNRQQETGTDDLTLFLSYRKLLRTYVDDFLLDLQDFRIRCEGLFRDWRERRTDQVLVQALLRNARERKGDTRAAGDLQRALESSVRRLIGFPGPDGTARILENKTTARLVVLIGQMERIILDRSRLLDRRRDLEQLALAFRHAASEDDAHRLASYAFGWGTPTHMHRYALSDIEVNPQESPWLQPPVSVELRTAARGNREFHATAPVRDKHRQRADLRLLRAQERAEERQFWDRLFSRGELLVAGLALPDETALNRVARVVRDCLRDPGCSARLLDGTTVRLHLPEDADAVAEIRSPGGVLHTRPYRLTRRDNE